MVSPGQRVYAWVTSVYGLSAYGAGSLGCALPRRWSSSCWDAWCRAGCLTLTASETMGAGVGGAGTVGVSAGVAEWLGTGLQSRLHGFESRHPLALSIRIAVAGNAATPPWANAAQRDRIPWATSSGTG